MWQPSWSCDPDATTELRSPYPWRFHTSGLGEDGRKPEHGYTISSPGEPSAQVSLKLRTGRNLVLIATVTAGHCLPFSSFVYNLFA